MSEQTTKKQPLFKPIPVLPPYRMRLNIRGKTLQKLAEVNAGRQLGGVGAEDSVFSTATDATQLTQKTEGTARTTVSTDLPSSKSVKVRPKARQRCSPFFH